MHSQPARGRAAARLGFYLLLTAGLGLAGCQGSKPDVRPANAEGLKTVSNAYLQATTKLNRAPKSLDELKPYLPSGTDPNGLLTSPNDGEPYVILWGTDPRAGMDLKPLVIGYEKNGKGGSRFVFTAMGVMQMTDADFKEARFPPGHVHP